MENDFFFFNFVYNHGVSANIYIIIIKREDEMSLSLTCRWIVTVKMEMTLHRKLTVVHTVEQTQVKCRLLVYIKSCSCASCVCASTYINGIVARGRRERERERQV